MTKELHSLRKSFLKSVRAWNDGHVHKSEISKTKWKLLEERNHEVPKIEENRIMGSNISSHPTFEFNRLEIIIIRGTGTCCRHKLSIACSIRALSAHVSQFLLLLHHHRLLFYIIVIIFALRGEKKESARNWSDKIYGLIDSFQITPTQSGRDIFKEMKIRKSVSEKPSPLPIEWA